MSGVREWLRSHGLSEYADRFAENRIDLSTLPDLTDEDLKELGVLLGDRRRMLRAIAEFAPTLQFPGALATDLLEEAERRHVTVMFADLVGSTALSTGMDPEDLREVFAAYARCAAETVRKFGGVVARYMGDGVLVYFGYPQAHEDDAERAVRAGLELITAVAELETHVPQQIRVGIATGLVVVGHLIPSGVVGETPNRAARLQAIAEPNTVVIAEDTRRFLGNLFTLKDLGVRDLKGIAGLVRVWAVLQPSAVASRFEAFHPTGMTVLVGREEETELLRRRWSKATGGEGQVVLLSGEAGIGKSRLAVAIMELLRGEPHTRLRYFCSAQHTNSPLHPIVGQMERAAGLARDDTLQAKLDKLDVLLRQSSTSAEDAALLAEMLSLPNDGRYPVLELAPRQRRERTMDALIRQSEALSGSAPLLVVLEDAHWADPTSLELFGRLVNRIASHRVLLIVTFRPEFDPPWIEKSHVTAVILNRLASGEVDAMIDHIVGDNPLPANIRKDIIERTDGIPLFVEEMTKAVLEAESEPEARRTAAWVPSPAVPASLHASLMARLDRLGPAKELAQIGAAIGREFSHALLAAVACRPEGKLGTELDSLIRAGLLFPLGVPPDATYLFKHALVQDAAYGLLLREPRRHLHARIADALEGKFNEIAENKPEVLARHCAEAGDIEKAAALWGKAGRRSAERSALVEATEQLSRALELIATLPGTPALRREAIKLHVELITPLLHVRGYAAPETRAAVERARLLMEQAHALGEPPEDPLLLFSVLYGLWVAKLVEFDGEVSHELAAQFLALAEMQDSAGPLMIGHRLMGLSLMHRGDIAKARAHLDRAISLYDPGEHRHLATRFGFGQDQGAAILSWRSVALWLLGYPEAALADAERALQVARASAHSATLAYVLNFGVLPRIFCGDFAAAKALINEFVPLKDQIGSLSWGAWGTVQRGWIMAVTGKTAEAVQIIASGVAAMRSTGNTMWMPMWLSLLAKANSEIGEIDEASRCIETAMTAVETTQERWHEAELNRVAGEIALLSPERDVAKAEAYFARALEVARRQQAKSWELRAAMSMARVWRDQGRRPQARKLLAPVHGWFNQGFDTLDLKQAKTLLDELAQ